MLRTLWFGLATVVALFVGSERCNALCPEQCIYPIESGSTSTGGMNVCCYYDIVTHTPDSFYFGPCATLGQNTYKVDCWTVNYEYTSNAGAQCFGDMLENGGYACPSATGTRTNYTGLTCHADNYPYAQYCIPTNPEQDSFVTTACAACP